jgi:putative spermidine/putrescine transport system permease protein
LASPRKEYIAMASVHNVRGRALLLLPGMLFVGGLLLLPLLWLLVLSFDHNGPSLAHYARLFDDPSYLKSFVLTFQIAGAVTLVAMLLGYPLCYWMLGLTPAWQRLALICVMIPFWTSLLVRTYAWLVLLQRRGLVNTALQDLGVVSEPLALMYNAAGTTIGMAHIMLPFLVLPLFASMQSIDRDLLKAAAALGGSPGFVFWRVFFPLSLPGLTAGTLLVFVLSIGYYVTPQLLGGGSTVMIGQIIQRNIELFSSWGAASAVSMVLLAIVMAVFLLMNRFLSLDRVYGAR